MSGVQKLQGVEKRRHFRIFVPIFEYPVLISKIRYQIDTEFDFLSIGMYFIKLGLVFQKLRPASNIADLGGFKVFAATACWLSHELC